MSTLLADVPSKCLPESRIIYRMIWLSSLEVWVEKIQSEQLEYQSRNTMQSIYRLRVVDSDGKPMSEKKLEASGFTVESFWKFLQTDRVFSDRVLGCFIPVIGGLPVAENERRISVTSLPLFNGDWAFIITVGHYAQVVAYLNQ